LPAGSGVHAHPRRNAAGRQKIVKFSLYFIYALPMRFLARLTFFILLSIVTMQDVPAAQDDTIRINTRLVEVDVVIRDKNGPVTNLVKEDFTILDNGVPQRIDVFSISSVERSRPGANVPALSAGVVSNKQGSDVARSATVILFDRLNTADRYQRDGYRQLLAYLKSARRNDFTAIYVLGDGLKLVQDFTNDAQQLLASAAKMEVGDLPGVDNRTVTEIAQSRAVGRVTRRDVRTAIAETEFSLAERIDPTEDAIDFIAQHLAAVPGRKSLIWMSAGIPLSITQGTSRDGKDSQLRHTTRLFTTANIAVYPVDLHGLQAPDPPRGRGRGRLDSNLPPDAMLRLADETGGRAFYFNNDLEGSIRTAISDSEAGYTLGFYPSQNGFDGKFHNLAVKVAREGVDVRHRTGYIAVKDQAPSEKDRRKIISDLLASPLNASQIGLQASVQPDPSGAGSFQILLRIDTPDLRLERRNDHFTGALDLAIRLESSKDKAVQMRTVQIDLTEDRFRTALAGGLTLQDAIKIDKPADRIRIVVQDRATGSTGSLWLPVGTVQNGH
jgi:VWFA-related protein